MTSRAIAWCFAPALLAATLAGCASGTTALWRAGVARPEPDAPLPVPTPPERVEVFFKEDFGVFEETESERSFMCGATTVFREAFLVPGPPPPDRDWEVVGDVTTEELPRDEARSRLTGTALSSVLGIGGDPFALFQVELDPGFREAGLARLRHYASLVGADAVVDVYATGEAEHHMFHGLVISFDPTSWHSPIYTDVQLLDVRLRDVRLHGTAVKYED